MRLSIALTVLLLCTVIAEASRAGSDADDVVILSVKPRSADVRPVIMPPMGHHGAQQSAQSRKAETESLRALPENQPAERARPVIVPTAL